MMGNKNIAILLNTCDKYSDIWENFFYMLNKNFPLAKSLNIYINSESIDYINNDFRIINIHPDNKFVSWSTRLKECVSKIEEDLVISVPEEYILESEVDMIRFNEALEIFKDNMNCAAVQLVKIPGPKIADKYSNFVRREYNYRNLISQQAAIWNREKYFNYINNNESPWEFETLSSARGIISNDVFYCVSDKVANVFDYNYGMLVYRGYWAKEELLRLEKYFGLKFNLTAREILDIESINNKFSRFSPFFIKLRMRKWTILIKKKIGLSIKPIK